MTSLGGSATLPTCSAQWAEQVCQVSWLSVKYFASSNGRTAPIIRYASRWRHYGGLHVSVKRAQLANAFEYSRETWHVCSAHRDPSNDAGLAVIGRHMSVPLTSEAATLTSSLTSMTLLGRPATRHVCRAHRDPPNDVGPVVIGRHMDVPLTS